MFRGRGSVLIVVVSTAGLLRRDGTNGSRPLTMGDVPHPGWRWVP